MTTPIVQSITDDLLSQLECSSSDYPSNLRAFIDHGCLAGLISRLRAAEKDAARYRWLKENGSDPCMWGDEEIDAAIERQI